MRRFYIVLAVAIAGSAHSADTPLAVLTAKYRKLLEHRADKILERAFVPSEKKPQGEIRLIQRGRYKILQNLLYTKFLKRATGEIRKKEEAVWKEGMAGYEDSRKYIDAMVAARTFIWEKFKTRENKEDRRQKMMVELIATEEDSIVVFYAIEISDEGKNVTITQRRPFYIMPVSRAYLLRDMHLIARDALKYSDETTNEVFPLPRKDLEKH